MRITINHLNGESETVEVQPRSQQHRQRLQNTEDLNPLQIAAASISGALIFWILAVLWLI